MANERSRSSSGGGRWPTVGALRWAKIPRSRAWDKVQSRLTACSVHSAFKNLCKTLPSSPTGPSSGQESLQNTPFFPNRPQHSARPPPCVLPPPSSGCHQLEVGRAPLAYPHPSTSGRSSVGGHPLRTPSPLHRDVHRLEVEKLLDNGRVIHDTLGDHASRGKHCQTPVLDL